MTQNQINKLNEMLDKTGNIVLDNKQFTECEEDKTKLGLIIAVENLAKNEVGNITKEEMVEIVNLIEKLYDLDNPEVINNKVTKKSFYMFKPVKNLTIN